MKDSEVLEKLEALAYAIYLDNRKGARVYEEWKKLWQLMVERGDVKVPEGAWI